MYLLPHLRRSVFAVLFASAAVSLVAARASAEPVDKYAAIAYSQGTGAYGYGTNFDSLDAARQEAAAQCSGDDAQVVVWTRDGWCALAVGDNNAYGYGWARDAGTARKTALANCRQRTTNSRIVVCVSSDGTVQK